MGKLIGCIFVAAGTAIGAGTLALPLVVAGMGYSIASLIFIAMWALMWISGLLTLEVNLAFTPPRNSYSTMAEATLGPIGKWVTYVMFLLLLYALTSAYTAGGSSLIQAASTLLFGMSPPSWLNATVFTLALGSIVTWSTRAVDLFNRSFFGLKIILLLIVYAVFVPQIDVTALLAQHEWRYAAAAVPVILTAFGFHIVIPSITQYIGRDPKQLKRILFFGSLLPLIVYLLWTASLLGTLPYFGDNSLANIANSRTPLETLLFSINNVQHSKTMSVVVNLFSQVIILTSFLGVSLSLFDFLHDKKEELLEPQRLKTAALTFIPPLLIAIFYPNAFVQLLSYASIFVAVILIILPALMAWRLRRMPTLPSLYRVPGGTPVIVITALLGVILIGVEICHLLNLLPVWTG